MPTLTDQQVVDLQALMASVEAAYRENTRCRTALSGLINVGRATCQDVVSYNLATKAVYAYQASVCGIIRANGGNAPVVPPPEYIAWRGVAGDAAVDIDCGSPQMRGLGATPTTFVDASQVEWRPGATTQDTITVQQVVAAAQRAQAAGAPGLGVAPLALVTIAVVGLFVTIGLAIVLKIVEALTDVPQKKLQMQAIATQRAAHKESLEKRWACYQDCTGRGRDPAECAKACDRLMPGFKPVIPGGGLGIVGTVAGLAIMGVVIYAGWRFVASGGLDRRRGGAGGRKSLPSPHDKVIDAEWTERAA